MAATLLKRLMLAAVLTLFLGHAFVFLHGDLFTRAARPAPHDVAVVFTGDYERIDRALDLIQAGVVRRVYISGANPNAGVFPAKFTADFGRGREDLARLIACCVSFGVRAETTMENAAETACWLEANAVRSRVLLVTSWEHMPRAYLALADFIGAARITPHPIGAHGVADEGELRRVTNEYLKSWAARLLTWAPRAWVAGVYGPFRDGCPPAAS